MFNLPFTSIRQIIPHTRTRISSLITYSVLSNRVFVPSTLLSTSFFPVVNRSMATTTTTSSPSPSVLVIGGNGALGETVLSTYRNAGWKTYSVGFQ